VSNSRHLLLHIGFPKTATTTLQRGLFRQDPAIAYIGKLGLHRGHGVQDLEAPRSVEAQRVMAELVRDLMWSSAECWTRDTASFRERLLRETDRAGLTWDPLVFSHEDIIGSTCGAASPIWLGYGNRVVGIDPDALAERIAAFAERAWQGPCSILLTVRRQDTFLASYFAQTFPHQGDAFDSSLERFVEAVTADQYYSLGGLALDYDWLVHRLQRALGEDRVHILVYEDMAGEPLYTAQRLHQLVGADPSRAERALSAPKMMVRSSGEPLHWRIQRFKGRNRLRHVRQWLPRRIRNGPDPRWAQLTEEMSRRILARYADSNRRLARRLGRPLESYGYYGD